MLIEASKEKKCGMKGHYTTYEIVERVIIILNVKKKCNKIKTQNNQAT